MDRYAGRKGGSEGGMAVQRTAPSRRQNTKLGIRGAEILGRSQRV